MSTDVLDQLGEVDQADVVRCVRVLLRRPMLRAGGPDGDLLPLVFRHRMSLRELFAGVLGYRLVVERHFARLYKTAPGTDPTRGEPTLTPLGYSYLALCLAVLTGIGQQTLLSRLVTDVRSAAAEAGVAVSDDLRDLRALTAALRHLVALGVISETEGTVTGLAGEAGAEALITVDTTLLGHVIAGPLEEANSPAELIELAARPGPRGLEHTVRRRLVEDPVTHYADLPEEQERWLRKHARAESRLLERCFGLFTESRLEGIAVTDPEGYLTDIPFPGQSTVSRIALLALPTLLADAPPGADGWVPATAERVYEVCEGLVHDYPKAWSKQAEDTLPKLVEDVLELLRSLRLARPNPEGGWAISPSAHRWVPLPDDTPRETTEPVPEPEPEPGLSLFDKHEGDDR